MSEETYGEDRARHLEALLRALAGRIRDLDEAGKLLADPGELLRLMGDIRRKCHYEVRATFDTPKLLNTGELLNQPPRSPNGKDKWTPDEDDPDNK
jgi:hypothetical protein